MSIKMSRERRGPLALELWAKQLIDSYPGVTVRNMTTSWRNGLAFCALIHRFRPDLIDYDKLDPTDIIGNCSLAFDTAESKLGIPSLLDPEDMQACEIPDRLSVLTYVAQFYSTFKNSEVKARVSPRQEDDEDDNDGLKNRSSDKSKSPSPEKVVGKRKTEVNEDEIMDRVMRDMPKRSIMLSTSNKCSECKNPVFISERVLFMKKLYHRTCFRCCNCENPLNPHIADVAPDGSLFCVEKACHAELLKRFQVESHNINLSVPDKNNIQKQNNSSVVKSSEFPSEISHLNSESKSDNVSENKENCQNDEHKRQQQLSKFGVGRVSAMRAQFDSVQGDGPTQNSRGNSPSPNILRNTKLMDFAGALLHVNEDKPKNDDDESIDEEKNKVLALEEQETKNDFNKANVMCSANFSEGPVLDEKTTTTTTKDINSTETISEGSDDKIDIKSTTEDTSIREKAILTVADQLKRFSNKDDDSTSENVAESVSEESLEKEENPVVEDNNIKEEVTSEDALEVPDSKSEISSESQELIEADDSVSDIQLENNVDKDISDAEMTTQKEDTTKNPFEEENDEKVEIDTKPVLSVVVPETTPPSPVVRKRVPISTPSPVISTPPSPMPRNRNSMNKIVKPTDTTTTKSTDELWKKQDYYPSELNPFESEEEISLETQKPPPTVKVKLEPKNPFEDDEDEIEEQSQALQVPPSPKPRSSTPISKRHEINNNKTTKDNPSLGISSNLAANFNVPPPRPPPPQPQPSPRKILTPKPYNPFEDDDNDIGEYEDDNQTPSFVRGSDDTSSISSKMSDLSSISGVPTPTQRSLNTSDAEGYGTTKMRSRKSRRAPLPPGLLQSTGDSAASKESQLSHTLSPPMKDDCKDEINISPSSGKKIIPVSPKLMKGLNVNTPPSHHSYRKKRRAPPPRRRVQPLPEATIKTEFADLEVRQKELERQGITLESTIRTMMEEESQGSEGAENNQNVQLDEMMVQLWSIVNEKNDILRRQTELEYLRRGHRLEEMQAELEFKLRILMDTPEDQKLPNHADLEQLLLQQLLKLVDDRNEVVEWLDYHRQQDHEEDLMLSKSISQFSNSKVVEPIPDTKPSKTNKKKDKKESKTKTKDDSPKEKQKIGKLKLGLFSTIKRNKKPKSEEDNKKENDK